VRLCTIAGVAAATPQVRPVAAAAYVAVVGCAALLSTLAGALLNYQAES
jgi:hypothetical protein